MGAIGTRGGYKIFRCFVLIWLLLISKWVSRAVQVYWMKQFEEKVNDPHIIPGSLNEKGNEYCPTGTVPWKLCNVKELS